MPRAADRAYAAHAGFVAPARAQADLWRVVAGVILALAVAFGLNIALRSTLIATAPAVWLDSVMAAEPGRTPPGLLLMLGAFGFVSVGVAVALGVLHQRGIGTLVGNPVLALRQGWRVLRAMALLGAVLWLLPPWGGDLPLQANLAPARWLALLPLSLLAIAIQVSAEELLFRGYLQQQLAARFRSPLIWMLVPSALFAAGHYAPAEAGDNAIFFALWAGVFGLLMADLTARAGTLGPAFAVHFANDISALLIISLPDGMNGLALFTLSGAAPDGDALRALMPVEFAMMIVSWLAARLALRR
ncbi:MAG: CPBP family intramembrane metalloprotease [Marinibacterium sp.]|nr:CPBP family intramembrane metalloprotease [Marinibacterium sp.]